mgnify:CR=1 FL=1
MLMTSRPFRRLAVAALLGLAVVVLPSSPPSAQTAGVQRVDQGAETGRDRVIHLPLSKSKIIDFDEDIRDILVSDPKIADAVVRSARRLYLIGNKFGNTNIVVFGTSGRPIASLELQVQVDTKALEALLKRLLPKSNIRIEAVAGTVVLSGTVGSNAEVVQAYELASRFIGADPAALTGTTGSTTASGSTAGTAGGGVQVVNALTVGGREQVMLKVTVAEVQRDVIKMLGINLTNVNMTEYTSGASGIIGALVSDGNFASNSVTNNAFAVNSGVTTALDQNYVWNAGAFKLRARLQAMEQNGLMKTLAEPNLSALSGEQAQFLVGGEYPVPVAQSSVSGGNTISVEFKTYGIALNFQPVVLAEDRINLTVKTEISELTTDGAVTIGTLTIPALRVRRAATTLEIPSGGAMVLGGLIKDDVRQAITGTPGLVNVPVLGTLFRSRDFKSSQTELAIFIQPIVVRPVAAARLQRPDRNFAPSGDASAMFMGRLNRIYRGNDQAPSGSYGGRFGYIFE